VLLLGATILKPSATAPLSPLDKKSILDCKRTVAGRRVVMGRKWMFSRARMGACANGGFGWKADTRCRAARAPDEVRDACLQSRADSVATGFVVQAIPNR